MELSEQFPAQASPESTEFTILPEEDDGLGYDDNEWEEEGADDGYDEDDIPGTEDSVDDLPPALLPMSLTAEQDIAVTALLDFIMDPDPQSKFFVLAGFAGTGKTFCMREVVARCKKSRVKFAFTTPTNKAAKVLRAVTGEACTIFSLLGLRIDKSGELKALIQGKGATDLSDYDAVFLDEASMVNSVLFSHLQVAAAQFDVKIIFMGDRAQLPPISEGQSKVWELPSGASLSKVMRHDNQILTQVTAIRSVMDSIAPSINIKSSNDGREGVWKMTKASFKESVYAAAAAGEFADGVRSKVIAWRNVRVTEYNDLIRHAIYGAAAKPGYYLPGDRIVAAGPCVRGDDTLLNTDDEAIVESAIDCIHPFDKRYQAIELKCRTELNRVIRLLVLHPDSKTAFDNDSQNLAHDAKGNGKYWKKFWDHKDLFHDIKYGYALTTHRAQGSTYENVWVDFQDILLNRNRKEAFQCLYVACSRPTTKLFLA